VREIKNMQSILTKLGQLATSIAREPDFASDPRSLLALLDAVGIQVIMDATGAHVVYNGPIPQLYALLGERIDDIVDVYVESLGGPPYVITDQYPQTVVQPRDYATLEPPVISDQCSICLENFEAQHQVVRLACRHIFHTGCLLTWLERVQTCPLCRSY